MEPAMEPLFLGDSKSIQEKSSGCTWAHLLLVEVAVSREMPFGMRKQKKLIDEDFSDIKSERTLAQCSFPLR
jgi:hypothetical protein